MRAKASSSVPDDPDGGLPILGGHDGSFEPEWTDPICRLSRPKRPIEPEGTPEVSRARRGPRAHHPLFIRPVRLLRIHLDVAVAIVGPGGLQTDPLVPAVHAADRIGLHRERQVLMHADIVPPDARRIGIVARERLGAVT